MTALRRKSLGPLHAETLDLHHAIEHDTHLGRALVHGTPTPGEYIEWLAMKAGFFRAVETGDPPMLPAACRSDLYDADAEAMAARLGVPVPRETAASVAHAAWLNDPGIAAAERERRRTGTIYVCAGSVFGSAVIRRQIAAHAPDWPMQALVFRDRPAEIAYLHQLRQRGDCADEARACFAAMITACDEIEARCA